MVSPEGTESLPVAGWPIFFPGGYPQTSTRFRPQAAHPEPGPTLLLDGVYYDLHCYARKTLCPDGPAETSPPSPSPLPVAHVCKQTNFFVRITEYPGSCNKYRGNKRW